MILILVPLLACRPAASWSEVAVYRGSADAGFGHAVAWSGDELAIGEPFAAPGRVRHAQGSEWLVGSGKDLLGSGLAGGTSLLVGAPRAQGGGAVLDGTGQILLQGGGVGTAPTHHGAGVAAIRTDGVESSLDDGWDAGARLWSLVSGDFDGDGVPELVAGLADGGLSIRGRIHEPPPGTHELGRGLAACDLDDDGRDELLVGVPVPGEVRVYSGIEELRLDAPAAVLHVGGGRAGHAVACDGRSVYVGAPDGGDRAQGLVAVFARPMSSDRAAWTVSDDRPRSRLGAALAIGGDGRLGISAPGAGEVRVFAPR